MNIGQQIIGEIVKQGMVQIAHPDPAESHVLVWKENAADQLAGLVMNSVGKRIEELEAALDQTLCCSNGHYNPLMKCDCYQKAHDTMERKI